MGQFIPVAELIIEIHELLEDLMVQYEDFVIAGDVNNHVESDESSSKIQKCNGNVIFSYWWFESVFGISGVVDSWPV